MGRGSGPTRVRVAVKAVVVQDGRLLTVKIRDLLNPERFYYALPGWRATARGKLARGDGA